MKKILVVMLVLISVLLFVACDEFFVDEETIEIAKSGTYQDCASLNTTDDKNRIEKCYEYVGKKQDDPAACAAASGRYRDDCYEDVAVDLGEESYCNQISSKYSQADCFTDIAIDKRDSSICANMGGSQADECYKDFSIDTDDFDTCALISSDSQSDECYMHFAVIDNNEELCDELYKSNNRDECKFQLALNNGNPLFCESIESEATKEECLTQAGIVESEGCTYDSDCDPICEGDTKWKMGCDPDKGECIKTFDTDCSSYIDTIAGFDFPQTCSQGECVRNDEDITAQRAELVELQAEISQNVKDLNAYRDDVNQQKLDANKKCLNALADVTNMFIIDSALRMGGIISSGITYIAKGSSLVTSTTTLRFKNDELIGVTKTSTNFNFGKDIAGSMGDYAGQVTEKMKTIVTAEEENKKPPIEDYIAFYCDYNEYLGEVLDVTGAQLDQQVAMAQVLESQINALE